MLNHMKKSFGWEETVKMGFMIKKRNLLVEYLKMLKTKESGIAR